MSAAHDRGHAFELRLQQLFEAHGYSAVQNVKKRGRSGAVHQVDVFAEFVGPLHTERLVIEAKAHDAPIDKDALLKLVQIVEDLGADRGILATTSYFTPGAVKMAEGRNVDLWDGDHVYRLFGKTQFDDGQLASPEAAGLEGRPRGVAPSFTLERARELIEEGIAKRRKGGLPRDWL